MDSIFFRTKELVMVNGFSIDYGERPAFLHGLRRAILTMEKAPYRLVILKRRFPHFIEKTIVRSVLKCIVLTIVDSHAFEGCFQKAFIMIVDVDIGIGRQRPQ